MPPCASTTRIIPPGRSGRMLSDRTAEGSRSAFFHLRAVRRQAQVKIPRARHRAPFHLASATDRAAQNFRCCRMQGYPMDQTHNGMSLLLLPLLLLAIAVASVPLARLLRLSAVVAYLAAGIVVGPF